MKARRTAAAVVAAIVAVAALGAVAQVTRQEFEALDARVRQLGGEVVLLRNEVKRLTDDADPLAQTDTAAPADPPDAREARVICARALPTPDHFRALSSAQQGAWKKRMPGVAIKGVVQAESRLLPARLIPHTGGPTHLWYVTTHVDDVELGLYFTQQVPIEKGAWLRFTGVIDYIQGLTQITTIHVVRTRGTLLSVP